MHVFLKDYNMKDFTYFEECGLYTIGEHEEALIVKLFIEDILQFDFVYLFYNHFCDSIWFWQLMLYETCNGTISDLPTCLQVLIRELERQNIINHSEKIIDERGSYQYFIKEEFELDYSSIESVFKKAVLLFSSGLHSDRIYEIICEEDDDTNSLLEKETSLFMDLLLVLNGK